MVFWCCYLEPGARQPADLVVSLALLADAEAPRIGRGRTKGRRGEERAKLNTGRLRQPCAPYGGSSLGGPAPRRVPYQSLDHDA
jgi:hypothetical protein